MNDPVTVGVLSLHVSKESKAILNAVEDLGHETEWLRAENTVVKIDEGEVVLQPDSTAQQPETGAAAARTGAAVNDTTRSPTTEVALP